MAATRVVPPHERAQRLHSIVKELDRGAGLAAMGWGDPTYECIGHSMQLLLEYVKLTDPQAFAILAATIEKRKAASDGS